VLSLADRIALVEGVEEVAELDRAPYERTLNLRDRDPAGLHK